jgi:hypothetical protein
MNWTPIADYVEPNWDDGTDVPPMLLWRRTNVAAFGYIRDGEVFDHKWVYVCDANKVTHFVVITAPTDKSS